jgi:hypothetical protein
VGHDLGVSDASTDEVYAAMDELLTRQDDIQAELARRHLSEGGIAMFDLSSSWMEGTCCELAKLGHSRDGKRGTLQIEYGLLADALGRPIAVLVFPGNTADPDGLHRRSRRGYSGGGLSARAAVLAGAHVVFALLQPAREGLVSDASAVGRLQDRLPGFSQRLLRQDGSWFGISRRVVLTPRPHESSKRANLLASALSTGLVWRMPLS